MRSAGKIGGLEKLSSGAVARQASARVSVSTPGRGFTDVTEAVADFVRASGIRSGLVTVFCRHTSASLTIQENADPDVRTDLMTALDRLAPREPDDVHGIESSDRLRNRALYTHTSEGPDDMPGHIRTMLTDSSVTVPVIDERLGLGTWQAIYLIEHRDEGHRRELILTAIGA